MTDAFFQRDGDTFRPSELTRGPWDPGLAHGGPPSALLVRAFESLAGDMRLVRFTAEIIRPIPIDLPIRVETAVTRAGKKAMWVSGSLLSNDKEVIRATGTAIRRASFSLPDHFEPPANLPPPESAPVFTLPFFQTRLGYHTAMELRLVRGTWGQGPCAGWLRMRVPLVSGEAPSAMQRIVVAADAGNGLSISLPIEKFTALNPNLTVSVFRPLEGDWVGLDAATVPGPDGIGLAESALHDTIGPIGRALQSLLLETRGG